MTGQGTVVSVSENLATVLIRKTSACSHDCAECSVCTAPEYKVTVSNPIGAKKGDVVVIESQSSRVLAIALCIYILPVFLMLFASVLCEVLSFSAFATAVMFAAMIALWVLVIKKTNRSVKMQNVIVQIRVTGDIRTTP